MLALEPTSAYFPTLPHCSTKSCLLLCLAWEKGIFALVSVNTALSSALTLLQYKVVCHWQEGKMLNFNSLCGINNVGRCTPPFS